MRYLSSILVLLLSISSFAINQYKFRLIDIVDGLSDNQIRGLSITPDGRIAVRTASIMNILNTSIMIKSRNTYGIIIAPPKNIMTIKGEYG